VGLLPLLVFDVPGMSSVAGVSAVDNTPALINVAADFACP
jgi:hypothetical protein